VELSHADSHRGLRHHTGLFPLVALGFLAVQYSSLFSAIFRCFLPLSVRLLCFAVPATAAFFAEQLSALSGLTVLELVAGWGEQEALSLVVDSGPAGTALHAAERTGGILLWQGAPAGGIAVPLGCCASSVPYTCFTSSRSLFLRARCVHWQPCRLLRLPLPASPWTAGG